MFAEQIPSGSYLQETLMLISILFSIGAAWVGISGRKETQKRQVSFDTEFARASELTRVEKAQREMQAELHSLRDAWGRDKDQIIAAGERRAADIHERMNDMRSEMSQIPAQTIALLNLANRKRGQD